jgi:hypothetical protein
LPARLAIKRAAEHHAGIAANTDAMAMSMFSGRPEIEIDVRSMRVTIWKTQIGIMADLDRALMTFCTCNSRCGRQIWNIAVESAHHSSDPRSKAG